MKCEPIPRAAVNELEYMIYSGEYTALGKYMLNDIMPMCKGLEEL
jgi:hypothetical protein